MLWQKISFSSSIYKM